jgi:hypothetical protein
MKSFPFLAILTYPATPTLAYGRHRSSDAHIRKMLHRCFRLCKMKATQYFRRREMRTIIKAIHFICILACGISGFLVWLYMAGGIINWLKQYIGAFSYIVGLPIASIISPFAIVYPFINWHPLAFLFLVVAVISFILTLILSAVGAKLDE